MSYRHARTRGFTLVEMSIVLVVIGLILSGGLMAVSPLLASTRASETNAKLDVLEDALLVYVIQNGCLPCPANGALATGAANAGQSLDNASALVPGACTANVCLSAAGVVPWADLGISEASATDAWGNRITYQVSAVTTQTTCASSAARITTLQTANSFQRAGSPPCYPRGEITVNDTFGAAIVAGGAAPAEGAAYVLVSHGEDGEGARAAGSGALRAASSGSANQAENADGDTTFVQGSIISTTGATRFDDIVVFRTAPLFVQLCGSGSCGNPS